MFKKEKKTSVLKNILPLFYVYVNGLVVQYDIPTFTVFKCLFFCFLIYVMESNLVLNKFISSPPWSSKKQNEQEI